MFLNFKLKKIPYDSTTSIIIGPQLVFNVLVKPPTREFRFCQPLPLSQSYSYILTLGTTPAHVYTSIEFYVRLRIARVDGCRMSGGSGRRNSPRDCGGNDDPAGAAYVPSGVGVFPNRIKPSGSVVSLRPRKRILKASTSPKMFS